MQCGGVSAGRACAELLCAASPRRVVRPLVGARVEVAVKAPEPPLRSFDGGQMKARGTSVDGEAAQREPLLLTSGRVETPRLLRSPVTEDT